MQKYYLLKDVDVTSNHNVFNIVTVWLYAHNIIPRGSLPDEHTYLEFRSLVTSRMYRWELRTLVPEADILRMGT